MIRRFALAFRALVGLHYSVSLAYRAQAVLYMISGCLPLIMMMIWLELSAGGPIAGYARTDFVVYFLFLFVARQMTPIWVIYLMDRGIREGDLAPLLLRPLHPLLDYATQHIAEILVRLPIVIAVLCFGLWLGEAFSAVAIERIPDFILSLILGWLIIFHIHATIAELGFWSESVRYLDGAIYELYTLLGGAIVPVELFPAAIRAIVAWSPFPYILDLPARIAMGRVVGADLWFGFAVQIGWIVVLVALRILIWRRGLARFSAMGN